MFKDDTTVQGYIESGRARIIEGDALKEEDVAKGWAAAQGPAQETRIDLVLFTVGTLAGFIANLSMSRVHNILLCRHRSIGFQPHERRDNLAR